MADDQGLLSYPDSPGRLAMLGTGAGLLSAAGWSSKPVSFGGILGAGLSSGLEAHKQAIEGAAQLAKARNSGNSMPSDIQEYEYAVRQGYKGQFSDWMAAKRGGAGEHGLTPIWGRDKDGKPVPIQLGKSGEAIASKLPDGIEISSGKDEKIDAGTHWVLRDPLTRQTTAVIPKDVAGEAREKGKGEAQATALATLPTAEANTQNILDRVAALRNHPGRGMATGAFLGWVPGIAGPQADFVERWDQLSGDAFLDAYAALRGGGAITEAEGLKATMSRFRNKRNKSYADIDAALDDFEKLTKQGLETIRTKAGQGKPAGSILPNNERIVPGSVPSVTNLPPLPPGAVLLRQ